MITEQILPLYQDEIFNRLSEGEEDWDDWTDQITKHYETARMQYSQSWVRRALNKYIAQSHAKQTTVASQLKISDSYLSNFLSGRVEATRSRPRFLSEPVLRILRRSFGIDINAPGVDLAAEVEGVSAAAGCVRRLRKCGVARPFEHYECWLLSQMYQHRGWMGKERPPDFGSTIIPHIIDQAVQKYKQTIEHSPPAETQLRNASLERLDEEHGVNYLVARIVLGGYRHED